MRHITTLRTGWKFTRGDNPAFADPAFDDCTWSDIAVPHDWAITGSFDAQNDLDVTRIIQNGETTETPHYGRTGGLPHIGCAWYRRSFTLTSEDAGRRVFFEFDGIMSHASVYVNGTLLGGRPFGYASFCLDATAAVRFDGENVLAVRVDNPAHASRWYPGAGIYREARLVTKLPEHIAYQGVRLTDTETDVKRRKAVLNVELDAVLTSDCVVKLTVESPSCDAIRMVTFTGNSHRLPLEDLCFWSPEEPACYAVTVTILKDGAVRDSVTTAYGFRTISFDADTGMTLNGKPYYLKGVCLHHDLGPLGAAFSVPAMTHRLNLLKEMGCNAIRTSHNPPAPQFLDLCDRLGFAVMDEAFDVWEIRKCEHDYHREFAEWSERDLTEFIRRDRNHPSVFFWSIGNEINEQSDVNGRKAAERLVRIARKADPTRPVSAGLDRPDACFTNDLPAALDLAGWNYKPHRYAELHARYPKIPQFGSETASTVSSRGCYFFPDATGQCWNERRSTPLQVSSYDTEFPPWATCPDTEFAGQDASPWIFGEFVWTGFDYLGEPTPFDAFWPAHASYFGIFDLAGLPKDRVWLYAARWTSRPVLHVLPHWTHPGREGLVTPVHVYTNCASVELFLNGESQGVRTRDASSWRLCWSDVVYTPGTMAAVGRDEAGREVLRDVRVTAGAPAGLSLSPDRTVLRADGDDLAYITVTVVDAAGIPVPGAALPVTFTVSGAGAFAAAANGDATSTEVFSSGTMTTFSGACMAVVRAGTSAGAITLTAAAPGLPAASCAVTAE